MKRLLIVSAAIFVCGSVFASNSKTENTTWKDEAAASLKQYEQIVSQTPKFNRAAVLSAAKAQEKYRRPSAVDSSDPGLEQIKQTLWKCTDSACIESFFDTLDKNYDSLSPAAKVFAIHVVPLRAFRGIFWKTDQMLKNHRTKLLSTRFLRSNLVSRIQNMASRWNIRLPSNNKDAFLDYLSAPYSGGDGTGVNGFANETQLQAWVYNHVAHEIYNSVVRLDNLHLAKPVVWDNQILEGANSFQDQSKRFSYYGAIETEASYVSFYSALHNIMIFSSYSGESGINTEIAIGKLYGLGGFENVSALLDNEVDGVSRDEVADKIRASSLGRLFTKTRDGLDGPGNMRLALTSAAFASVHMAAFFDLTASDSENGDHNLVQTGFFRLRRPEKQAEVNLHKEMYDVQFAVNGATGIVDYSSITERDNPVAIRSLITGEIAKINVDELYLHPPTDLKVFLVESGKSARTRTVALQVKGKRINQSYHDYEEGIVDHWDASAITAYNHYFPSVTDDASLLRLHRVLHETRGHWATIAD